MSNRLKHVDDSTTNPFPVYSLEGLEWWLKRQPTDGEYDFEDINNCALCQYARSRGLSDIAAGGDYIRTADRETHRIEGLGIELAMYPTTFGAALTRVRQALGRT